jgi:hypothetical protein
MSETFGPGMRIRTVEAMTKPIYSSRCIFLPFATRRDAWNRVPWYPAEGIRHFQYGGGSGMQCAMLLGADQL